MFTTATAAPATKASAAAGVPAAATSVAVRAACSTAATLTAADKIGRVCRGVELDPLYVDVIARRYQAAAGNPAVLIETGEAFDVLSARRAQETAPV
jgi:hypothetical protein